MATFNERLRALRREKQLSQSELAKFLGVSKSAVNMYERGEREPNFETLEAIADFFNVDMNYLLGKSDVQNEYLLQMTGMDTLPKNILPMPKMKTVPLIGEIACGTPILAAENILEDVMIPENINADCCLKCKGDSMIGADIKDGDIVYIKMTPEVADGQIAAVIIDDEATLKRVYYDKEAGEIDLYPENPAYRPLHYRGQQLEQIRIFGKAVGLTRGLQQ